MDTDVLVVGAGPTGLMLANQLARRGTRVIIIDRHSGPAQQSRAMAVQARTLEIYDRLGIADRSIALGRRGIGGNIWSEGRLQAHIPLGDMGKSVSPFPYVLMLGQDDNEIILGDRLRDWNMNIEWNTELTALAQKSDHVSATLKLPDGASRTITAAYVAGCDGGHSAVRQLNHIGFPGSPYEHTFFVADTEATGAMVQEELNVYLWRDGFHLFFPMRGANRWRVIGILPKHLRAQEHVTFDQVVPAIQQEAGAGLSFQSCDWFSTYRIYHRRAERFQAGRCFLLGDAAHVHSPMGGQGMNTGLQDAYNLGWKLSLVLSGRASASLLDSYEDERIPVAQRLLDTTDRAFRLVVSENWVAGLFRRRIIARMMGFAMKRNRVRQLAFRTLSQTGIHYRASTLSINQPGLPGEAPQAGDRFPWMQLQFKPGGPIEDLFQKLDDSRFTLMVFGQMAPSEQKPAPDDLLRVHVIEHNKLNSAACAGAHIPIPSFYLLRPDGHIGLAGTKLAPEYVTRYLTQSGIRTLKAQPKDAAKQTRPTEKELV